LQIPYTQPADRTVTITNTGTGLVELTQPSASNYEIGYLTATTLASTGATATFTVRPYQDLPAGNYDETIIVYGTGGASATVSANFTIIPAQTYTVTVSSAGTDANGGGEYAAGDNVFIDAGTPPAGHRFVDWTTGSSGVVFYDADSSSTSFTMPANEVTVTANFELALNLVRVAGQVITLDGHEPVVMGNYLENLIKVSVDMPGNIEEIGANDIELASDQDFGFHMFDVFMAYNNKNDFLGADFDFSNPANLDAIMFMSEDIVEFFVSLGIDYDNSRTISLFAGGATRVYLYTVTESNGTQFYEVTVNRIDENAPSIAVGNISAARGQIVSVPIVIRNNPGIDAIFQFLVEYDAEKLTLVSYKAGDILAIPETPTNINANQILFYFENAALGNTYQNGTLIELQFLVKQVNPDAEVFAPVKLLSASAFNYDEQRVAFALSDGGVTVNIIWGDANGDGAVNPADVTRLRRYFAGHDVVIFEPAADANCDGEVNPADVTRLRRYFAGHDVILGCPLPQQSDFQIVASPATSLIANEVKISVSHETAASSEYVDVEVSLDENPELFSLQLALGYDAAVLEAVDITSGSLIPIPVMPRLSANNLSLYFEGATLDGTFGTGNLATIRFRVLDDAVFGSTAITIDGIYAGNALEDTFTVSTIDGSVFVEPQQIEATLVSAVPTASVKVLNGNKNDLTITVTETYSDGSTNKITETVSINNNAAGSYTVGKYVVYVDTKGGDQIRQCYIVK